MEYTGMYGIIGRKRAFQTESSADNWAYPIHRPNKIYIDDFCFWPKIE